jgi:hypothetical protein
MPQLKSHFPDNRQRLEFDDTHRLYGLPRSGRSIEPEILEAIFFDEAGIMIDESLDPKDNPSKQGHYFFTLASRRWSGAESAVRSLRQREVAP